MPARMDAARAIELACLGKPMKVLDAHEAGLIDDLADDAEALLHIARERAAAPRSRAGNEPTSISSAGRADAVRAGLEQVRGSLPSTDAAAAVVGAIETGLNDGWQAALDAERASLVHLRSTEQAKAALQAFFDRTRK